MYLGQTLLMMVYDDGEILNWHLMPLLMSEWLNLNCYVYLNDVQFLPTYVYIRPTRRLYSAYLAQLASISTFKFPFSFLSFLTESFVVRHMK